MPFPTPGAPPPPAGVFGAPPAGLPPPPPEVIIPANVTADRNRAVTGLLLLVIGFVLGWIPFISIIGSLISLIGIIFVILSRKAYGESNRRYVVTGGVLFLIAILATIGLVIGFAVALIGQVSTTTSGAVTFHTSALKTDLTALFIGIAVVGIIAGLSQVVLVYGLSDRTTRILLWTGFVTSVVLSVLVFFLIYPEVATAVSQATSGTKFNPAPISSLETQSDLLGATKALPSLLFAWAYYRARAEAMRRTNDPNYC